MEDELSQLENKEGPEGRSWWGRIWWARLRLERVRRALESWQTGEPLPPLVSEVQAWRFGKLGLVAAPGEIFTEIGMAVKQGPEPQSHDLVVVYNQNSLAFHRCLVSC